MNCNDNRSSLSPQLFELLKQFPEFRFMKAPVDTPHELYLRYPDGLERGTFAFVYNENSFFSWRFDTKTWEPFSAGMNIFFNIIDSLESYAELMRIRSPRVHDAYIILSDANYEGKRTWYAWNGNQWVFLGIYDFDLTQFNPYNITLRQPLPEGEFYTFESAIRSVFINERKPYLVLIYQIENGEWESKRFISEDLNDFEDTAFWQDFGSANMFINSADEEDITAVSEMLRFKDRSYNPTSFSGLGRKIIRKNIASQKNILTQEMLSSPNTVYEIRYDYDLNGKTIEIPNGCTLDFQGGSLNNGTIVGHNTSIMGGINNILKNILLTQSWLSLGFLQKVTVKNLRQLSETESSLLKGGCYEGVELYGYYERGDTPAPLRYFLSENGVDDGGSVIECSFGVKLYHDFGENIDLSYFGASGNLTNNITQLRSAISFFDRENISRCNISFNRKVNLKITDENEININNEINFNGIVFETTESILFSLHGGHLRNINFDITGNTNKIIDLFSNSSIKDVNISYKKNITLSNMYVNPVNVYNDSSNVKIENVKIENYKNVDAPAAYIAIRVGRSCFNINLSNITIENLTQLGDGTIGDAYGQIRGIYWDNIASDDSEQTICSGSITSCYMNNFINVDADGSELVEDADGIYISAYGSNAVPYANCDITIRDVRLIDTGKRNIKIQATGVNIENSTLILNKNDTYENLMIFSRKSKITNCDFTCKHGFFITGALSNSALSNSRFWGNREQNSAFQFYGFANNTIMNIRVHNITSVFKFVTDTDFFRHEGFKNSVVHNSVFDISSSIDFMIGNGFSSGLFEKTNYNNCTFNIEIKENISSKILSPSIYTNCVFKIGAISISDFVFNVSYNFAYDFINSVFELLSSVDDSTSLYLFKCLTFNPILTVDTATIVGNNKKVGFAMINCGTYIFKSIDISSLSDPNAIYTENNYPNAMNKNISVSLKNINLNDSQYIRFGSVAGSILNLSSITINNNRKIEVPLPRINLVGVVSYLNIDNVFAKFNNPGAAVNVNSALDAGIYIKDSIQYRMFANPENALHIVTV